MRSRLKFQLTRPVRGEPRLTSPTVSYRPKFQLTRPVRGEPNRRRNRQKSTCISTHSPRAGRTGTGGSAALNGTDFNSLAPCGANLELRRQFFDRVDISTHSPRAGRTYMSCTAFLSLYHFNSLAPCGANLRSSLACLLVGSFQLTRPVRGEPRRRRRRRGAAGFQLTRPVRGEPKARLR